MGFTKVISVYRHSVERDLLETATFTLAFEREGEQWVGVCLELGTSAYADSLEEADDQLVEAVLLQLNEMERLGFTEEYIRQRHVRVEPLPGKAQLQQWALAGNVNR